MDTATLETRYSIAQAAVDLYEQDPDQFTLKNVGEIVGLSTSGIYGHFNNKEEILRFWYESVVHRYRLMAAELDEFESLTLAEKISNFIYASLEMMGEHRHFVVETFDEVMYNHGETTGMITEIEKLITSFIEDDGRVPGFNRLFTGSLLYQFLADEYLHIVRFWISDESENNEKTLELVDKLTSFLEEMLYNAVATKGFDLARFLYEQGAIRIPNLLTYTRRLLPF
ncbi:MAG: TetR/AcrR family transcriptional regulator [Balneolaceae bacterium]|jgi:AcrR family transcriptional regulator|nr:MAG: TetR/AcrR family transcriptional regulator [Balneolaceae bacterium]